MVKPIFKHKSLLKIILVLVCCFNIEKAYASSNQLFYENSTLELLLDDWKGLKNEIPHNKKIINIYITFALRHHHELSQGLISSLAELPEWIKPSVVQGVVNVLGKDIKVNKSYNLTPQPLEEEINRLQLLFPSDNRAQEDYNLNSTDYLWSAFYATGNKDYIMKIITFLNKFPLKIRAIAAESVNRDALKRAVTKYLGKTGKEDSAGLYKDLIENLSEKELHQFVSYKIIEWSLSSNREQYPGVDKVVKEIFTSNPGLNFYKYVKP